MSTPSPAAPAAAPAAAPTAKPYCPVELIKPYLAPYYLTVAAVLGAITVGFVVVTVLLILVATNFNALGWVE